jgi:hypothetical protein
MSNFIQKQKKHFGIELFKILKHHIIYGIILIPIGLAFGLIPVIYSNIIKHIVWGAFIYSFISFSILIIDNRLLKTIKYSILPLSFFISIIFELNDTGNQLNEIILDFSGVIIAYILFIIKFKEKTS